MGGWKNLLSGGAEGLELKRQNLDRVHKAFKEQYDGLIDKAVAGLEAANISYKVTDTPGFLPFQRVEPPEFSIGGFPSAHAIDLLQMKSELGKGIPEAERREPESGPRFKAAEALRSFYDAVTTDAPKHPAIKDENFCDWCQRFKIDLEGSDRTNPTIAEGVEAMKELMPRETGQLKPDSFLPTYRMLKRQAVKQREAELDAQPVLSIIKS